MNSISGIRRTRRGTSGTAASRRANFSAPRSTPIGSKGRTNRRTGIASIRRRSCSILTRRRCSSLQSSAAKRAPVRARATGVRRWAVCRASGSWPFRPRRLRDTPAGTSSSMSCTSKDSPRARTPGSPPRSAARLPA